MSDFTNPKTDLSKFTNSPKSGNQSYDLSIPTYDQLSYNISKDNNINYNINLLNQLDPTFDPKQNSGTTKPSWFSDVLSTLFLPITAIEGAVGTTFKDIENKKFDWFDQMGHILKSQYSNDPYTGLNAVSDIFTGKDDSYKNFNGWAKFGIQFGVDTLATLGFGAIADALKVVPTIKNLVGGSIDALDNSVENFLIKHINSNSAFSGSLKLFANSYDTLRSLSTKGKFLNNVSDGTKEAFNKPFTYDKVYRGMQQKNMAGVHDIINKFIKRIIYRNEPLTEEDKNLFNKIKEHEGTRSSIKYLNDNDIEEIMSRNIKDKDATSLRLQKQINTIVARQSEYKKNIIVKNDELINKHFYRKDNKSWQANFVADTPEEMSKLQNIHNNLKNILSLSDDKSLHNLKDIEVGNAKNAHKIILNPKQEKYLDNNSHLLNNYTGIKELGKQTTNEISLNIIKNEKQLGALEKKLSDYVEKEKNPINKNIEKYSKKLETSTGDEKIFLKQEISKLNTKLKRLEESKSNVIKKDITKTEAKIKELQNSKKEFEEKIFASKNWNYEHQLPNLTLFNNYDHSDLRSINSLSNINFKSIKEYLNSLGDDVSKLAQSDYFIHQLTQEAKTLGYKENWISNKINSTSGIKLGERKYYGSLEEASTMMGLTPKEVSGLTSFGFDANILNHMDTLMNDRIPKLNTAYIIKEAINNNDLRLVSEMEDREKTLFNAYGMLPRGYRKMSRDDINKIKQTLSVNNFVKETEESKHITGVLLKKLDDENQNWIIPNSLWQNIKHFVNSDNGINDAKKLAKTFTNLTNLWKTLKVMSPGFWMRISLGNLENAIVSGQNIPRYLKSYTNNIRKFQKAHNLLNSMTKRIVEKSKNWTEEEHKIFNQKISSSNDMYYNEAFKDIFDEKELKTLQWLHKYQDTGLIHINHYSPGINGLNTPNYNENFKSNYGKENVLSLGKDLWHKVQGWSMKHTNIIDDSNRIAHYENALNSTKFRNTILGSSAIFAKTNIEQDRMKKQIYDLHLKKQQIVDKIANLEQDFKTNKKMYSQYNELIKNTKIDKNNAIKSIDKNAISNLKDEKNQYLNKINEYKNHLKENQEINNNLDNLVKSHNELNSKNNYLAKISDLEQEIKIAKENTLISNNANEIKQLIKEKEGLISDYQKKYQDFDKQIANVKIVKNQKDIENEAIKVAETVGFNYSKLNTFERRWAQNWVPFYSFAKFNLCYHLKNIVSTNAVKYGLFHQEMQNWNKNAMGLTPDMLKQWDVDMMYLPIFKSGDHVGILKVNAPISDVYQMFSPRILDRLNPALQAMYSFMTGHSLSASNEETITSGKNLLPPQLATIKKLLHTSYAIMAKSTNNDPDFEKNFWDDKNNWLANNSMMYIENISKNIKQNKFLWQQAQFYDYGTKILQRLGKNPKKYSRDLIIEYGRNWEERQSNLIFKQQRYVI